MQLLRECGLLALLCLGSAAVVLASYEYSELEQWVINNGGMIKTEIKRNKDGFRGLFTKTHAYAGDYVATIPSSCMINAGALDTSVVTGTLIVLRELLDPHSRFKPYMNVWPSRENVLNACNFPTQYLPLLEMEFWEGQINITQNYLHATLHSQVNGELDFTVKEVLGNAPVTLEDLKYACAVSSTRYVTVDMRKRLMMIPIFDMKNHKRNCVHTTSALDDKDEIHILVGEDVGPGTELCYSYNDKMRDDYGVVNYGFLPELEDPPRLLQVDHPEWDPTSDNHHALSEEPFTGNKAQVDHELNRLETLLAKLEASDRRFDASKWPKPGEDWKFDTVMGLRQRRRNAIRYEIKRLKDMIKEAAAREL